MTISSTLRTAGPFIGNNTATVFGFAFKVFAADQLEVVKLNTSTGAQTTLALTTDYTVALNGDQDGNPGGSVTLPAVLATGYNLTLTSNVANLQPTNLTNQGGFYPEVITDALDRATIQIQQMSDDVTRSIKAPLSDDLTTMNMTLPVVASRINKILAFDGNGMPTVVAQSPSSITGNTTIVGTLAVTGTIQGLTVGKGTGSIATNTVFGSNALQSNTTGSTNTAVGYFSSYFNTTGSANTAVGCNSLQNNTTGQSNTAVGYNALYSNTTAINNTAVGSQALNINTIGIYNTAVGSQALLLNTTGQSNTAVGLQALSGNTIGIGNVAVGYQALSGNTTANYNTAAGYLALTANTTGTSNAAFGFQALASNLTGQSNCAFGYQALSQNLVSTNTAIGVTALQANTTGDGNTAVGYQALLANTTAALNTAVGYGALKTNIVGVSNTGLGYGALTLATGSNNTAIGRSAGSTLTTGSSNVLIGYAATPSAVTVGNEVSIANGSVIARFQGAAAAWTFVSDARDKDNIQNLSFGLDFVTQLQPRKFSWNIRNSDVDKGKEAAGFIAQELLSVVESQSADCLGLVYTNDPNQFSIAQTNLIPVLVNAIKELNAKFEAYVATHP